MFLNVCKQKFLHISRAHISKIKMFYIMWKIWHIRVKTKISWGFQICINVPLTVPPKMEQIMVLVNNIDSHSYNATVKVFDCASKWLSTFKYGRKVKSKKNLLRRSSQIMKTVLVSSNRNTSNLWLIRVWFLKDALL